MVQFSANAPGQVWRLLAPRRTWKIVKAATARAGLSHVLSLRAFRHCRTGRVNVTFWATARRELALRIQNLVKELGDVPLFQASVGFIGQVLVTVAPYTLPSDGPAAQIQ